MNNERNADLPIKNYSRNLLHLFFNYHNEQNKMTLQRR